MGLVRSGLLTATLRLLPWFSSLMLVSSAAVAAGCIVRGAAVSLADVEVRPLPQIQFRVSTESLPTSARTPRRPGAPYELTITGPIAFSGTRKNIWYETTAPVNNKGAMVSIRRGALLVQSYAVTDNTVEAAVVMDSDCRYGTFVSDTPAQSAGPVRVPCSSLKLYGDSWAGEAESTEVAGDAEVAECADGHQRVASGPRSQLTWWQVRPSSTSFRLYSAPRIDASRVIVSGSRRRMDDGNYFLEHVESLGNWLKVRTAGCWGEITGWMSHSEFLPPFPLQQTPRSDMCEGHGRPMGGRGYLAKQGLYKGPASIAPATVVFAKPGRGAWARIRERLECEVRYVEGEDWVELTDIPGLVGFGFRAHVRASTMTQLTER